MPEVLGEEHDLPAMVRVMRNLAIDGLHYGVGFAANGHGPLQIWLRERLECGKHMLPSLFPDCEHRFTRRWGIFEFGVAIPVRFLTIAREKVGPA